ncbi:MAG TPA: membrane protein insertion efficiency factor YidD [Gaiellaceae bacterium]
MTALATLLIRAYRLLVSPFVPRTVGGRCKYHPSCSQYALDALREYGLLRGLVLAGWRLLRCNPWSHGGVDHARDQRLFPLRKKPA